MELETAASGLESPHKGCRWHPRILAFFITAALGLSVMSSLDCKFLAVDLPFIPKKYHSQNLGVGLWSFEAPDGRCLSYEESYQLGGFSEGDDIYSRLFINDDTSWSTSRVLAISCALFGSITLISIWVNVFQTEPQLVDILACLLITTFALECAKFGIFQGVDLCASLYWYNIESYEYSGSIDCRIDRGAIMNISSITAYFLSTVIAVGFAARYETKTAYDHDESSLHSWMASENGSTENRDATLAQNGMNRRTSDCYAWSHSTPSTAPSTRPEDCAMTTEEDYHMSTEEEYGMIAFNTNPEEGQREAYSNHMQAYPPANRARRTYDDTSTLTYDPGY